MYLTVELAEDDLAQVNASALAEGLPVLSGEYLKDGGYHYYPAVSQVRSWVHASGVLITHELTGGGYYRLLLRTQRS